MKMKIKKLLFTILTAGIIISCQNYDDRFQDLTASLNAVTADLVAVTSGINTELGNARQAAGALQSSVEALGQENQALLNNIQYVLDDLAAVQAELDDAATADQVTALLADLDAINEIIADLTENYEQTIIDNLAHQAAVEAAAALADAEAAASDASEGDESSDETTDTGTATETTDVDDDTDTVEEPVVPDPPAAVHDVYTHTFTGLFGGVYNPGEDSTVFAFPAAAEVWAGFAQEGAPTISLQYGGHYTITVESASNVEAYFRFERLPHPDVEPAVNIDFTINGAGTHTIDIPAQDAANTYASHLFYLKTRDQAVTITSFELTVYTE